jgi:hypothetical protein
LACYFCGRDVLTIRSVPCKTDGARDQCALSLLVAAESKLMHIILCQADLCWPVHMLPGSVVPASPWYLCWLAWWQVRLGAAARNAPHRSFLCMGAGEAGEALPSNLP